MNIHLIAVGNQMPEWVSTGYNEYVKRLPRDYALHLIEIPLGKRTKSTDIKKLMANEGQQMLAKIPKYSLKIALEVKGNLWSTEKFAGQLQNWHDQNQDISLLIGGPEGLDPKCLATADHQWSLSPLTLPHPLVRIIVAEQIYRAWSLLVKHPYHR